jgi:ACS family allantoate permease-like MFS transporter
VEIVTIWTSTLALKRWPNHRGYIGAAWLVPNVIGAILIVTLPYSNKAGILICLYVTGVGTPGFVIALAWINNCVTGHTKKAGIRPSVLFGKTIMTNHAVACFKTTTNAAFLIGYCLGNLLAPLM